MNLNLKNLKNEERKKQSTVLVIRDSRDPCVLDAYNLIENSHAFIFTKSVNKCFRISKE